MASDEHSRRVAGAGFGPNFMGNITIRVRYLSSSSCNSLKGKEMGAEAGSLRRG